MGKPSRGVCSVEECSAYVLARGWCDIHYDHWHRHGDPLKWVPVPTTAERFWAKVDKSAGANACWPWTASRSPKGYGKFMLDGTPRVASRLAWQLTFGPIEDGFYVLHHCDNPSCCNPAHLWLGTKAENNADMIRKGRYKKIVLVTECHRGHLYDEANTYWYAGRRECRACKRVTARERKLARSACS